jgi:hypothetical protein
VTYARVPVTYMDGVAVGNRGWRLPAEVRAVTLVAFLGLGSIPVILAAQFGPLRGLSVTWSLVLSGWALAWGWLGWRLATVAVWLTFDAVVIRNIWKTRRLPLAEITGVSFRQGTVTVTTAWSAAFARSPAASPDLPAGYAVAGPRHTLRALSTGTARLTGRRCPADEAADAITAAAGLGPLPARKERISLRRALIMAPVGLAFLLAAQFLDVAHLPPQYVEYGTLLSAPGFLLFFPAAAVAADHLFHRPRA